MDVEDENIKVISLKVSFLLYSDLFLIFKIIKNQNQAVQLVKKIV